MNLHFAMKFIHINSLVRYSQQEKKTVSNFLAGIDVGKMLHFIV